MPFETEFMSEATSKYIVDNSGVFPIHLSYRKLLVSRKNNQHRGTSKQNRQKHIKSLFGVPGWDHFRLSNGALTHTTCEANYAEATAGSTKCPSGYVSITDAAACKAAGAEGFPLMPLSKGRVPIGPPKTIEVGDLIQLSSNFVRF